MIALFFKYTPVITVSLASKKNRPKLLAILFRCPFGAVFSFISITHIPKLLRSLPWWQKKDMSENILYKLPKQDKNPVCPPPPINWQRSQRIYVTSGASGINHFPQAIDTCTFICIVYLKGSVGIVLLFRQERERVVMVWKVGSSLQGVVQGAVQYLYDT